MELRKVLHTSVFLLVVLALLFVVSAYNSAHAAVWSNQPADRYGDQGLDNSLALSREGLPRISYREFDWYRNRYHLKYAVYDGMAWHVQYVEPIPDAGFATSLALDASDFPAIAYHDINLNLKYAKGNGSTWEITTIAKGANPSLVLDNTDRPHISYVRPHATTIGVEEKLLVQQADLMYARWDGLRWQLQVVEQGGRVGEDNALALDSKGNPHIVYVDFGVAAPSVKYATWNGSSWRISTIETGLPTTLSLYGSSFFNSQDVSIAIDAADRPCISYFGAGYSLKYATWNGSSWQIQVVDGRPGMRELPNSLALDSAGRPHILYRDGYIVPSAVKYAEWDGTAWKIDTVASGNEPGFWNSLKLDDKDQPHLSYYVKNSGEGGGALYYARIGSARTVTATPAGGLFDTAQSVTLSTGEVMDTIYYTTDGSVPTRNSTRYFQLFPIQLPADRVTTLKFFAVQPEGHEGPVQTEIYTIDTSTPIYTLKVNKNGSGVGSVLANGESLTWTDFSASAKYRAGTTVTLTPQTDFGSLFIGWSGACTGTGPCQVAMDATKEVTASYKALVAADGFVSISAGYHHGLLLNSAGTVLSWGYNNNGQLGDGTTTDKSIPTVVRGVTGVRAIAAGAGHSLALKNDGTVFAWGLNQSGQVGDGTVSTNRSVPTAVKGLSEVTAIAAGFGHSLALRKDGTVLAWGHNGNGQLGDGTTTSRSSPIPVHGLSGVTAIAAGAFHSLALKNDGSVVAWGYNGNGRLGDGSTAQRTMPSPVVGLTGITALAAGSAHTLDLRNDGTVWAWGSNLQLQLGDWGFFQQVTPRLVPHLSGITAITAGDLHSLALRGDGTVFGWGVNSNGQLGDGTTSDRIIATQNPKLAGTSAISAGAVHTLALQRDGMILAWGHNGYGQLGDWTNTPHITPVQVRLTLPPFLVTVDGGIANGNISCTSPVSYNKESICTVSPAQGYVLSSLTVNGVDRLAGVTGNVFTISDIQADQHVTGSFAPATTLTVAFAGTGGGSVHGDISCSKGASCLPMTFARNSLVTLIASPDANSLFGGWSGDCTGTGTWCRLTMDNSKAVTSTFNAASLTRILGGAGFSLLSAAYAAAANNSVIQARDVVFEGDLVLNRPVNISLLGGYDTAFSFSSGETVVNGRMIIRSGSVRVDGFVLR